MGNTTANSPKAWQVQYIVTPATRNAKNNDAGPLVANDAPLITKRPVPGIVRCERLSRFDEVTMSRRKRTYRSAYRDHLQVSAF